RVVVIGRLHDQLAGAAWRDHVEHADTLADQFPFDAEVRVAFGHHTDRPAGAVGKRPVLAIGSDFGAGEVLRTRAVTAGRVGRPRALRPNEHPLPASRVFSQLVHRLAITP